MMDTLKTIGISAVVVIVALLLTGNIGGTAGVGGVYEITKQYFNSGISVTGGVTSDDLSSSDDIVVGDDLTVTDDTVFGSANATTSINFGKACWQVTTSQGSTTYVYFRSIGVLATSSTTCL